MKYFALIGAAGYIAPRHLQAISETGQQLLAAVDPHDSVGKLDSYFPQARFFTDLDLFASHLGALKAAGTGQVDYVSICSPNYLHDSHAALALRADADAICEKPLALDPQHLDALASEEIRSGRRVYTILQLRLLPALLALKQQLDNSPSASRADVVLTYVTQRGHWYDVSWKGQESKSGGVAMNIGIHFFDLLRWLFGEVEASVLHRRERRRMAGRMALKRADVRWLLSLEAEDLPADSRARGATAYRSLTLNGTEVEFTGFTDLHTESYRHILAGRGFGLEDARPAVEVVHRLRDTAVQNRPDFPHPGL